MADSTGSTTVMEHRPKPEISWMAAILGADVITDLLLFHSDFIILALFPKRN